jgi:adenylyl-sulfate kinase
MKKKRNITPYSVTVDQNARRATKGHLPAVLWFTGFSGSGKSTVANAVEKELVERYCAHTYLLDGDNIRNGLNADLGFSLPDRSENIRRVGEVARLMVDAGLIVLTAFISPLRADRDLCRDLIGKDIFFEIFVDCSLEECAARDPKGLYAKARAGEILEFTGVSSPYEAPIEPELVLKTDQQSITSCTHEVVAMLVARGILPGTPAMRG